ncbi:MAG: oligosaccharide flippase family protein [Clostridiales bacterium]|nr:oligosaccharide flippase family protein [Clostridiales bacterium]
MDLRLKKDYIYNLIYRLSICLLPLVITPYVSRVLRADQVGIYSFSSTVACFFIMFGKLGIDNYGNRSIAACRDDIEERSRVFWGIYIFQLITSLLSILVFVFLILFVYKENSRVYWMQLIYVSSVLFDVSWLFFGMEKFRITTIRSLVSRALIIILVFTLVHTERDLWVYTGVMSLCFLIEQLQLLPFIPKLIKLVPIKGADIIKHIVPNFKLFIPLLAFNLYSWLDKIFLGIIHKSTTAIAFYVYAENIINLPKGILSALDSVMLPRISNLVANNHRKQGLQNMQASIRFNSFICCALCFGIAGIAPSFIPWFFGSEYRPAILITMELAVIMIPMTVSNVIQIQYLIPFYKEDIYTRAVSLGALTNIILNLIFIPLYGILGAVIAKFGAEILVCAYQLIRIRDVYAYKTLAKTLLPFILCGLLEFAVTYSLNRISMASFILLIIQVLAGGVVYLLGCYIYVVYISKEYSDFLDIIRSFKL